eukprot:1740527-Amphidinium_carterae.1
MASQEELDLLRQQNQALHARLATLEAVAEAQRGASTDPVGGIPSEEVQRVAEENRALHARLSALEGAQNRNPTTRGVAFGVDTRAIGKPD